VIGRLRGRLVQKQVEEVILDVGGVGYAVHCPLSVLEALPPEGSEATLVVHTHVREDALVLYGFCTADERQIFRLLIGTTGIGPKLALACLSGLDATRLARAIVDEDAKALALIPGVGKRTAERIILELKEKVRRVAPGRPVEAPSAVRLDDLASALRNLGYATKEVDKLVAGLSEQAAGLSFEALLREALRRLAG
jgi:Holliday junction DNA helicase RuvA